MLAAGRRNAVFGQAPADGVWCVSLQEFCIDAADNFGLLFIDNQVAVRSLVVAEEPAEGNGNLAVCKPLTLAPGTVLGNAAAFFLGKRGHDRQHQFALAVEGPDVFLFKVDLNTLVLQPADGGQAVDRVSGKTADGLGDDEVNLPVERIIHHVLEALAFAGVAAGLSFVRIYGNELPVGTALDVIGVVVDLRLVAGELLVPVRGDAGVGCNAALCARDYRPDRMQRNG